MKSYRVALLGCPSAPSVPWNTENLSALRRLGFNTVQLNIAWGSRPADEPLNLEDIVELSEAQAKDSPQVAPLRCDPSPTRRQQRKADLRHRIGMARQEGLHTIFHFGAPFNAHLTYGDNPPNCLADPGVVQRYERLLKKFGEEFPGVDDILVYTYDQDAWLCSEFGSCPRCMGIPLHQRVSKFVNQMAEVWHGVNPQGRLWWEPWELSAGQVFKSIELLDPSLVGLALHSNVAEVMTAMPVDHWLEVAVRLAKSRQIPTIVEHFLGSPTEEVEPFLQISCPLLTLRALRRISALAPDGIKEYYGIVPSPSDANLRATALFFKDPQITDEEALLELSANYGASAGSMIEFWRTQSRAVEMFPWYMSWWAREVGRCNPIHSMRAAFLRGQQAHTPSWESTRRAIFMKTDDLPPDPWMLEDVQLQCEFFTEEAERAWRQGKAALESVPKELREGLAENLRELKAWKRNALSYAYHIRETNLTGILRQCFSEKKMPPDRVTRELKEVLEADLANQGQSEPCASAIALLESDPQRFVETYFSEREGTAGANLFVNDSDRFTVTSR